jgi:hypothetical protein
MWVTAVVKVDDVHADLYAIYLVKDYTGKENGFKVDRTPLGRMFQENLDSS